MGHLEGCEKTILYLQNKVKDLEHEIECKDIAHLHELTVIRDYLESVMQKYLIN